MQTNYKNTEKQEKKIIAAKNSRECTNDAKKERLERLWYKKRNSCEILKLLTLILKNWVLNFPVEDKIFGDVLVDCYET